MDKVTFLKDVEIFGAFKTTSKILRWTVGDVLRKERSHYVVRAKDQNDSIRIKRLHENMEGVEFELTDS